MRRFFGLVTLSTAFVLVSLLMPAMAQDGPTEAASPIVGIKVIPKTSKPVRDLPEANLPTTKEVNPPRDSGKPPNFRAPKGVADPKAQLSVADTFALDKLSDPIVNVDGMGGSNPNDTNGDIGPNDYVQMINSAFQIFDRQGVPRSGPAQISTLWTSADATDTSECATQNAGDPVVLYDRQADRWLLSQFANTQFICVAISQTPDPTGAYYLYQFTVDRFPDYYKFGIWPDGYYVSANYNNPNVAMAAVFDRANMLNGNPAGSVEFSAPTLDDNFDVLIPSNMEGETPPPAGAPNYMYRQVDSDIMGGGFDRLELWEFKVNWANPTSSTFTGPVNVATAPFNSDTCGYGFVQCIDQPGTTQQLDPIQIGTMYRFQYRNFGNKETMVGNFTVDANGSDGVGIRWFVLERSGGGVWAIANEGTYAPQPADAPAFIHRWMGSAAMDRFGNIALGFTASSAQVVFPSARYTGRLAGDPLGLMPQPEIEIQAGTSSGGANRWGDYYTMSVDPVDDCTFWYTGDYKSAGGPFLRQSRIASFRFSDCSADLAVTKTASPDPATAGEQITYTISVSNNGPLDATDVIVVDNLPAGFIYVADNVSGDECGVADQIITCAIGDISSGSSSSFTITALIGSDVLQIPDGPTTFDNLVEGAANEADNIPNNNAFTLSTLVNESADLSVEKICKPDGPAIVGEDTGSCEIFITNNGPSMARNAKLVDEIFSDGSYTIENIDVVDPGAACFEVVGEDVECDLGDIDAGEVIKVTIVVNATESVDINDLATVSSDTPDPDISNNSDEGQINFIVPTADLVVTKQCQPVTSAPAGSEAFCEIFVYNNGPQLAENVQLDDQIASDGEYTVTDVTTSAGTCTPAPATPTLNADVLCQLGDVASGDTVSIVVDFTSNDDVDVDDIATATSDTYDPDPNNNTATGSVTFAGIADLAITKTDNPDAVAAGTQLVYTLTVSNAGPSTAINVVVADQVPAGVTMISAVPAIGSCVMGVPDNALQPTLCGIGDLAPAASVEIIITVFVLPTSRGLLHNDATVSSDYYDDDNSDNQVTEDTTIIVVTSLELEKYADHDPVVAGTQLRYVITLSNGGPSTATGVMLTDTLPPETSWLKTKVLGGVGDCLLSQSNPDIVSCTLNNMDPGETFTVVITVLVDPSVPDGTSILNIADSTSDDGDNDHVEVSTLVTVEADLWIDKTGGFITQNPGKNIIYTLTVHNDSGCSGDDPQVCGDGGPSDALNVVVLDTLPATNKKLVVTFVSEDCLYDYDSHTVTCVTPVLAAGDTVFHEIEATPRGRLRAITNLVDVSSDTTDPNTGNNHDEMLLIVGGGGQKGTGE